MTEGFENPTVAEKYAAWVEAQKKEKSELFKNASFLAGLLLLYNLLRTINARVFWIAAYVKYTGKFSLDIYAVQNYLADERSEEIKSTAFLMTGSVVIVILSTLGIFIVGQFIMKIKLTDIVKPYRGFALDGVKYFPATLTLNLIGGVIVTAIVNSLSSQGINVPVSDFSMHSPTRYELIIQFVYVCLLGPICEEFIYRGLVIKLLAPFGKLTAVVFSALIFGLMHGNIEQAITAALGGVVYALVAVKYNSIAPTVVIHILNNISASISDYGGALGWSNTDLINRVINICALFFGFYGVIVLITELIYETKMTEPDHALSAKKRRMGTFTNIFVLIYFGYLLWEIIGRIWLAN